MSWLLTLIILCFTINYHSSDARSTRNKKLPSAFVVGTVYCDTCFHNDFSKTSHFISGALITVECDESESKSKSESEPSFRKEVQTNKHGEFKVELPFSVSKHVNKIKGCSVKLISSSEPYCAVASTATSSSLHLKSRKPGGTHIFSAGFFTFKPLTQPNLCNQKPITLNSKKVPIINSPNFDPPFPPPLQDPPASIIPPIDNPGQFTPLPLLPRLPPLPQLPDLPILPPGPKNDEFSNDQKTFVFPPNPFQPPLIPNPFQPPPSIFPPIFPTPPPSVFPPIFPAPSPPSFFPPVPSFPPIPFFTPPPSPPPPAFRLIPPFPFQPSPGFPGIPPAASSSISKGSSP